MNSTALFVHLERAVFPFIFNAVDAKLFFMPALLFSTITYLISIIYPGAHAYGQMIETLYRGSSNSSSVLYDLATTIRSMDDYLSQRINSTTEGDCQVPIRCLLGETVHQKYLRPHPLLNTLVGKLLDKSSSFWNSLDPRWNRFYVAAIRGETCYDICYCDGISFLMKHVLGLDPHTLSPPIRERCQSLRSPSSSYVVG